MVSEIGESRDIYRFDIPDNHLDEAVELFNQFKNSNRRKFSKSDDKRLKKQPIDKFDTESHWSVDRWWTKEKQIELGIVEEDKVIKIEEFGEIINDISQILQE